MRDQIAHLAAALLALAPLALWPSPVTGAWAGLCMGLVREVTEEGRPVTLDKIIHALGSWEDLLFWTAGGVGAGSLAAGY